MTRQDFQALAQALSEAKTRLSRGQVSPQLALEIVQDEIIKVCKRHNANFDIGKFRDAAAEEQVI